MALLFSLISGFFNSAIADIRYDQICVSSEQIKDVFYVYDNLHLLRENQLTKSPVKEITAFRKINVDLPQSLNKNFTDPENKINLSQISYSKKSEVNSEDGRVSVTLNGRVILSIPFMNPDQNTDGRFATTIISQIGMIFDGKKINQITYSDCGQLAD